MRSKRRAGDAPGDAPKASGHLRPLPDCIRPGVRVLLVGINPGVRSAAIGHHFAGYSNRFWKLLYESRLVPEPLRTEEDRRLPEWGYGITNLVARPTAGIGDLRPAEYAAGRRRLLAKVERYRPAVVALVGVTLYRVLFPGAQSRRPRALARGPAAPTVAPSILGLRSEELAGAEVFVLPNPSGRNANYTYAEMLDAFRALQRHLRCSAILLASHGDG